MANNVFIRDWLLNGEQDREQLIRYLNEVRAKNNVFISYVISNQSRYYYRTTSEVSGVLRVLSENDIRDAWFFRVKKMEQPFEFNINPDRAHQNNMTLFINYKVHDYQGEFIGVAGVGLTLKIISNLL